MRTAILLLLNIHLWNIRDIHAQSYDADYATQECRTDAHEVLFEPSRRILQTIPRHHAPGSLCDTDLRPGWYRFALDGRPADMANECLLPDQCGSSSPIWIHARKNDSAESYDSRPTLPVKNEAKSLMACVSVGSDCCAHTIPIQVRNCGEFYVYFLWIPPAVQTAASCPAFCAETRPATARTGRDTDNKASELSPRISASNVRVGGAFRLRCSFDKPSKASVADGALYKVSWLMQQIEGGAMELIHAEDTRETFSEVQLMRIGVTVTCSVKVVDMTRPATVLMPSVESPAFYVGIKIDPLSVNLREGETQKVEVSSTVPFPCDLGDTENCQMPVLLAARDLDSKDNLPSNAMVQGCSVSLLRTDCDEGVCGKGEFQIAGVQDFANDGDRVTVIETLPLLALDVIWAGYDAPDIQVTVTDVPTSQCYSFTDPHVVSLDGGLFDLHTTGTFVMYQAAERDFEVHARVWDKCDVTNRTTSSISTWCHCGVAARENFDVIVVDMCGDGVEDNSAGLPDIQIISELPLAVGTHIVKSHEGKKITIFFPSGAFVRVDIESWGLGVTVQAPSIDYGATRGLCGVFDGSKANDASRANIEEWRLEAGASLFERVPVRQSPAVSELSPNYCTCEQLQEGCLYQQPISRPNLFNGVDETATYVTLAQKTVGIQSGSGYYYPQQPNVIPSWGQQNQGYSMPQPAGLFYPRDDRSFGFGHQSNRRRRSTGNPKRTAKTQSKRRKREAIRTPYGQHSSLYSPRRHLSTQQHMSDDPSAYNNAFQGYGSHWPQVGTNRASHTRRDTSEYAKDWQQSAYLPRPSQGQQSLGQHPSLSGGTDESQSYAPPDGGSYPDAYGGAYQQQNYGQNPNPRRFIGNFYDNYPYYGQSYNYDYGEKRSEYKVPTPGAAVEDPSAPGAHQFPDPSNGNTDSRVPYGYGGNYVHQRNQFLAGSPNHFSGGYGMTGNQFQSQSQGDYLQDQSSRKKSKSKRGGAVAAMSGPETVNVFSDNGANSQMLGGAYGGGPSVPDMVSIYPEMEHSPALGTQSAVATFKTRASYIFLDDRFPKTSLRTRMVWPNIRGWTKTLVTAKCASEIRESTVVEECGEVLGKAAIQTAIDICVRDVNAKGDWSWTGGTYSMLENMCEEHLIKRTELWRRGRDGTLSAPDRIISALRCPHACNGNGQCTSQRCTCDSGFGGPDCSTRTDGTGLTQLSDVILEPSLERVTSTTETDDVTTAASRMDVTNATQASPTPSNRGNANRQRAATTMPVTTEPERSEINPKVSENDDVPEEIILTRAENDGECFIVSSSCDSIALYGTGFDAAGKKALNCVVTTLVPGSKTLPGVLFPAVFNPEVESRVVCPLPDLPLFGMTSSEARYDVKVTNGFTESNSIGVVIYLGFGGPDPCIRNKAPVLDPNQRHLRAYEGENFVFELQATDPDDPFVYFELDLNVTSHVFMTPTGLIEWTVPSEAQETPERVTFTIKDQCGATTRETVQEARGL